MPIYGLTDNGLIIKTLTVIRDELSTRIKDTFGTSVKSDNDRAFIGQLTAIISEIAALVWEQLEVVNSSQDPDKATGAALDALCTLTGTFRPPASYSTVVLTLTGIPTSVVPEDSIAETDSTEVKFQTIENGTITLLPSWAGTTPYVVGNRVTNNGNAYQCTVAGTSGGGPGPITEAAVITDGGVTWTFLGTGTGAVDVDARATVTGPNVAVARDIIVISTPVAGWQDVINLLDATVGRDEATDEELRLLRETELAGIGNSPVDALRADLLDLDKVESVTVFVNNTDTTNVDGMPPHSVEALVRPTDPPPAGFNQTVWDALLANVAAGIVTHGTLTGTATDSQGTIHTMKYSRPTEVPIYIILNVTKDPDEYPDDGDDLIKEAIVTWGDGQSTGKDAVASGISAQAFKIDGVLDVTAVKIGVAPAPTLSVTIPIALRELATYDTGRISVISINGTP